LWLHLWTTERALQSAPRCASRGRLGCRSHGNDKPLQARQKPQRQKPARTRTAEETAAGAPKTLHTYQHPKYTHRLCEGALRSKARQLATRGAHGPDWLCRGPAAFPAGLPPGPLWPNELAVVVLRHQRRWAARGGARNGQGHDAADRVDDSLTQRTPRSIGQGESPRSRRG